MIPDGYRILLTYDGEKERFVAAIPELGNQKFMGQTRAEALGKAEEAVEQAFRQAAEAGQEMPPPIDASELSGEVSLSLSQSMHRDLIFQAAQEGVELNQLAVELLSAGLAPRLQGKRAPQGGQRENRPRENRSRDRRPRGDRYFNIMDDKASFIEYVRNLEPGGAHRHGGRGRGRGRKS